MSGELHWYWWQQDLRHAELYHWSPTARRWEKVETRTRWTEPHAPPLFVRELHARPAPYRFAVEWTLVPAKEPDQWSAESWGEHWEQYDVSANFGAYDVLRKYAAPSGDTGALGGLPPFTLPVMPPYRDLAERFERAHRDGAWGEVARVWAELERRAPFAQTLPRYLDAARAAYRGNVAVADAHAVYLRDTLKDETAARYFATVARAVAAERSPTVAAREQPSTGEGLAVVAGAVGVLYILGAF